jgi:predicted RNA methylase
MRRPEIVSLEEVKKRNLISKYSPLFLLAQELNLKFLIRENGIFTGPAVGLATLIDKITLRFKINSFLDLCCGTGALSKIALLNGVRNVTCLDSFLKPAKENLSEFKNLEFVEKDLFKFDFQNFYDVIVIDPPQELIERLLRNFIPKIKNKCNIFIMWHGSNEENKWNEYVRERLRKIFDKVVELSSYGEEISCCSSTKKGKEMLDKLFKTWY